MQAAERQGVAVRPVNVNYSQWDCSLEKGGQKSPALRLGLRMVKGLSRQGGTQLVEARSSQPYISVDDLAERAALGRKDYAALAAADALNDIAGNRYQARWAVAGIEEPAPVFPAMNFAEGQPLLHRPAEMASVIADYASTGVSLRGHPLALLRAELGSACKTAAELWGLADGSRVQVAGIVITRQRPGSAANVTFVTLEDETGFINLVVWQRIAERQRRVLLNATVLGVRGEIQKQDGVLHVIANQLEDRSSILQSLMVHSRDFH